MRLRFGAWRRSCPSRSAASCMLLYRVSRALTLRLTGMHSRQLTLRLHAWVDICHISTCSLNGQCFAFLLLWK